MREIMPGVFAVAQDGGKGFGYSYFVARPAGNLVLCASRVGTLKEAFEGFAARGGVKAVVISDRHLGGASTNQIAERFGAAVYCSAIEADAMGHRQSSVHIDHALPFERTVVEGDVLLVPTAGHTAGQFSTLMRVGDAKILFTADFLWREAGRWRPGNLSRKTMLAAFEGLRDLDFDHVVPWVGYGQDEFVVPVASVNAAVDEMIAACPRP